MVEGVVELVDVEAVLPQQVDQRARVDRAGARVHRHALERGEAHRRVDRAAVADRRDRRAAAEVADDEADLVAGRPSSAAARSTDHATESPWKP